MSLVVIVNDGDWSVVVAKCKPKSVAAFLVSFYRFAEGINGVKNLHFLIRDRVGDEVVLSFRMLIDGEQRKAANSKVAYKLKKLLPENEFVINPDSKHKLFKYVAWSNEGAAKIGEAKFSVFCDILSRMSRIVVDMAEKNYFESDERVELAHTMAWMVGCTEYGLLSTKHFEVGYYDRVTDKSCQYLKEIFQK
jgi:hypothetical protein